MRPGRAPHATPALTRRGLASRIAGAAAAVGLGAGPGVRAAPALDPDLRDAALRGLALAGYRGDPVTAAAARAAMARLAASDPEGALLARLYQMLDVRPAGYFHAGMADGLPGAGAEDLAVLHEAITACHPVAFAYTDMEGEPSERMVLPLALVHPPQGVKLLAWCLARAGFRQFFVRAMRDLAPQPGDFRTERLALLEGLVEKEEGRG